MFLQSMFQSINRVGFVLYKSRLIVSIKPSLLDQ